MDQIVRDRLTARESVVGAHEPSLTHVARHFFRFAAAAAEAAESGDAGAAEAVAYQELLKSLSRYQFDVEATRVVQATCRREVAHYASATLKVERDIEETEREIEELRETLQRARERRRQKAECEAIAAVVNKHRTRPALEADVRALQERLRKIDDEAAVAEGGVAMRQRQVRLLLASLQELTSLWEEGSSGGGERGNRNIKSSPLASGDDDNMDEDDDEQNERERFKEAGDPGSKSMADSDIDMGVGDNGGVEEGEIPE